MTFIVIPHVASLTFDASNLLNGNPSLLNQVGQEVLSRALHSFLSRSNRRRGMSRREMRKATNRKRRWFVDNIIMHHKRLHDRNRAIVVSNARSRALAKREASKNNRTPSIQSYTTQQRERKRTQWQNGSSLKERGVALRGAVDARRTRARSRWLAMMAAPAS